MGIQNLLQVFKPCLLEKHIQDYAGKRFAVDVYVWLHRGTYSCAEELCMNIKTDKYLNYCIKMLNLLRHFNIVPVMVFDGARLPMKENEEKRRRGSRKEELAKGIALRQTNPKAAMKCFQKAVDIKPYMAKKLIDYLKLANIEYIVAPYEADAQMAFLAKTGYVDGVISEDSDMIPYGVPLVLYKLKDNGSVTEYHRNNLYLLEEKLNLSRFTQDHIIMMCILSGCDYLESLRGIGVMNAYRLVRTHRNPATIFHHLRRENKAVTKEYEERFHKAFLTFKHQRVFDPETKLLVNFSELPENILFEDVDFLGPIISADIARMIAEGEIDPMTRKPYDIMEGESITTIKKVQEKSTRLTSYFKKNNTVKHAFIPPRMAESDETGVLEFSQKEENTSISTSQSSYYKVESYTSTQSSSSSIDTQKLDATSHVPLILNRKRNSRLSLPRQKGLVRSIFSRSAEKRTSLQLLRDSPSSESGEELITPRKKHLAEKVSERSDSLEALACPESADSILSTDMHLHTNQLKRQRTSPATHSIKRRKTSHFFKQLDDLGTPPSSIKKVAVEAHNVSNASSESSIFEKSQFTSTNTPTQTVTPMKLEKSPPSFCNFSLEKEFRSYIIDDNIARQSTECIKSSLGSLTDVLENDENKSVENSSLYSNPQKNVGKSKLAVRDNQDMDVPEFQKWNNPKKVVNIERSKYQAHLPVQTNSSQESTKRGNLLMHFLEKCKRKPIQKPVSSIGTANNPIIL